MKAIETSLILFLILFGIVLLIILYMTTYFGGLELGGFI